MRKEIDCAVLIVAPHERWMLDWLDQARPGMHAIRLHTLQLDAADPMALASRAPPLRRFDACLIPVKQDTLGWARTVLACAGPVLTTPLMGITDSLKSAALQDLLQGGLSDFVRAPVCLDELRARIVRSARPWTCANSLDVSHDSARFGVEQKWATYGAAGPGLSRRPPPDIDRTVDVLNNVPSIHAGESFRQAKSRIVDSFEREFVCRALTRHGGNVARAARASAKHRRAFWAVMQKHGIDAARYRRVAHSRMSDSEN